MIDIINTVEAFDRLKPEWEALERNPSLRIFQTYAWCRTAWDCYVSKERSPRLWILRWHQDGKEDVVIFPFYIDGEGCLRFIMDTHSDVCDSVHSDKCANRHWAYKEASDKIRENTTIKSVFLQKMSGLGEALNYFSILLPGSVVSRDHAFSWLISERTNEFIAGQSQFKRKDRDRLKSILRASEHFDFRILSAKNHDQFPQNDIVALRKWMIGKSRADDAFISDNMVSFAKTLYEMGRIELSVLCDGDGICALAFRLLKETRINFWIVLYKDSKLPTEMYLRYMQEKAKEQRYVFDFGVGAYGYKLQTFRPEIAVTFSIRYANGIVRQLLGLMSANIRLLKDLLKPRLKKH